MGLLSEQPDLFLCGLDTALWSVNNAHIDVMAQSVFFKLGGTFLAEGSAEDRQSGGGTPTQIFDCMSFAL